MTSRSAVFGARHRGRAGLLVTFAVAVLALAAPATTLAVGLQIASDPFTQATCHASSTTNHHANVEPDSFSNGSTIVAAYQVGRIYDGGACAIGFSTSTNNGSSWTSGLLPGLTKYTGGGSFDRATDAAVAYDAQDNVWMISSLVLTEAGGVEGVAIYTSRSTDGGLTWGTPVLTENTSLSPDKNWVVCDNTATSPFYGNCYTEWDDNGVGNKMQMNRSTDGGLTLERARDAMAPASSAASQSSDPTARSSCRPRTRTRPRSGRSIPRTVASAGAARPRSPP